jgi:hypothetical protein
VIKKEKRQVWGQEYGFGYRVSSECVTVAARSRIVFVELKS